MPRRRDVHEFEAKLLSEGPGGAWTYIQIPFDAAAAFGTRARVPVKGTINGNAFRSSIFPAGQGRFTMMVNKQMQAAAGAKAGGVARFKLGRDDEPREVTVLPVFARALKRDARAREGFEALSQSCRKEYADWIAGAKQDATRERRIEKALAMLAEGRRLKS